jgi:hypothetical protein
MSPQTIEYLFANNTHRQHCPAGRPPVHLPRTQRRSVKWARWSHRRRKV